MTWVVGATSPFGQAVLVSDVRVSFTDGTENDYIQKAYCVGRYVIAGFAGSVQIGFRLIDDLAQRLSLQDERLAWQPVEVATAWVPIAAGIFANSREEEKRLKCHVLLAGISPTADKGGSRYSRTYLMTLRSPNFVPGFSRKGIAALQIGTGAKKMAYRNLVRTYFRDPRFAADFGSWGGNHFGSVLGHSLGQQVSSRPLPGVSPHFHVVTCGRGNLYEGTNDFNTIENDQEIARLRMPPVATSYEQFLRMAAEAGHATAGASA
jgi:hypothetical protein